MRGHLTDEIKSTLAETAIGEINQVREFNPPPSPAKITDSRAKNYIAEFGEDSWELDALSPRSLQDIATRHILELRDEDIWQETEDREYEGREELENLKDYL